MSENFAYTNLLKKGIELESCGMGDVARDIYVTFVRENAMCTMGSDRVDVLALMYGNGIYEGVTTWAAAVNHAYMALLGKRFLLQLYEGHENTWRFSTAGASGKKVNEFFAWLKTGVPKRFDLKAHSECMIAAINELNRSSSINVTVSSDILRETSFISRVCKIASVDLNSIK